MQCGWGMFGKPWCVCEKPGFLEQDRPGLKFCLCCLLALWPWAWSSGLPGWSRKKKDNYSFSKAFAGLSWCEHSLLLAHPCPNAASLEIDAFPESLAHPTFRSRPLLFLPPFVLLCSMEGKAKVAQCKKHWTWTWETKLWMQGLALTYWHFGKVI